MRSPEGDETMKLLADEELQKQGANARALGRSVFDNPLYAAAKMPAVTGEGVDEWARKEQLWRTGWEMENAIRSQP